MPAKIKDFWEKYEQKIILILGLVLISVLSFEAGVLKGADFGQKPLIIESVSSADNCVSKDQNGSMGAAEASNLPQNASNVKNQDNSTPLALPQNCSFLGSKNSNKYHLPSCRWAKSIKPENRVCFSSEDEAKSRGYLPDKNCIK